MGDVKVTFRDGKTETFKEGSRSGGSYYQTVKYDNGMVIITDVWGKATAIPMDLVTRVETSPTRGYY